MTWIDFFINLIVTIVLSISNACDIVLIVHFFSKRDWLKFLIVSFFLTLNTAILALAWSR